MELWALFTFANVKVVIIGLVIKSHKPFGGFLVSRQVRQPIKADALKCRQTKLLIFPLYPRADSSSSCCIIKCASTQTQKQFCRQVEMQTNARIGARQRGIVHVQHTVHKQQNKWWHTGRDCSHIQLRVSAGLSDRHAVCSQCGGVILTDTTPSSLLNSLTHTLDPLRFRRNSVFWCAGRNLITSMQTWL